MTFFIILFIIAFLFYVLYKENKSIQTTRVRIVSSKIPASFEGFRIVQVSDLHNAEFGDRQMRLLRTIKEASPDLIAVTGDLIDSRHTNIEKAMEFVSGAVKVAPVYYVTGNHEARTDKFQNLKNRMEKAGAVILRNSGIRIFRGNDSIELLGLEDPAFANLNGKNAENATLAEVELKKIPKKNATYTILLSHRPELIDVYRANGIDLALCGHAHGGQIRLPYIGGLFAPNQGFLPKYSEGIHKKGRTEMVVSRGLGNSLAPVRIHNRPEIVVITLSKG